MWKQRRMLWFIGAVAIFATVLSLPETARIRIPPGQLRVDRVISVPSLSFSLGPFIVNKEIRSHFGLDLSGGTHLVLEAEMKDIPQADRKSAYDAAKAVVERRINLYGLTEPVVQQSKVGDSYRIIAEIPGVSDASAAIELIGKTAQLEFREEGTSSAQAKTATEAAILSVLSMKNTGLTGKNLKRASVQFNSQTASPEVGLEFDEEGAKLFEAITSRNIGKPLGIFLDEEIISYPPPIVKNIISGGSGVISGGFSLDYAKQLAVTLNAGALPVPIHVVEQRNIGATLGAESIQKSVLAGVIGFIIIGLFMIVNYGFLGIVANVALIIYALITFALFRLIPVTLTLAGIAGFILSIGMAVDANILIFERILEEQRAGKDFTTSLRLGFDRAFPSIRDSNVSSLIMCGILYWFGTGMVRGFAITLSLGILVSLFSAITVTRTFLRMIYK